MLPSIKAYIVGVILTASLFLFSVLAAFGDTNAVVKTQNESFLGIVWLLCFGLVISAVTLVRRRAFARVTAKKITRPGRARLY